MKTRIRHHRQLRRLTQAQLAKLAGTTAATISRLETADMNVSMSWLHKFAEIFNVPVAELIPENKMSSRIPCVGEIDRNGALSSQQDVHEDISLDALAKNPIAIRIAENMGTYCAGDIVIADRLQETELTSAVGKDCFVAFDEANGGFGRFISSGNGTFLLVPPEPGHNAYSLAALGWVAPVVMLIRYP